MKAFQSLFAGKRYLHRRSTQGDWVAQYLFEDLLALRKANAFVAHVESQEVAVNTGNKVRGKAARRGDGTLGELVPGASTIPASGFRVARGPVANLQIGVEVKVLAKAMIKQIDRVINDLDTQVTHFKSQGPQAIAIAVVGVNHADRCTGYEGKRRFASDVPPSREAPEAITRIQARLKDVYDELVFLRFKATNEAPYAFSWVDQNETSLDYASALTRISRLYEERF
jgi:hypothetical protein